MISVTEHVVVNGISVDRAVTYLDKSTWGPGPWQEEPDKIQFVDQATGLDCLAVRQPYSGSWCGYVGVPESHPAFGLHYDKANDLAEPDEDNYHGFKVHGGLTFSDFCQDEGAEVGICHVPAPGRPDRVYWLGFDCAHSEDLRPGMAALLGEYSPKTLSPYWQTVYRTLAYVQAECAHLAEQLHALG